MTRIYFCGPFPEVKMKIDRSKVEEGDRKIVEAMLKHTRPVQKTNYDPDPKIKTPKKPKKGGKKWPKKK